MPNSGSSRDDPPVYQRTGAGWIVCGTLSAATIAAGLLSGNAATPLLVGYGAAASALRFRAVPAWRRAGTAVLASGVATLAIGCWNGAQQRPGLFCMMLGGTLLALGFQQPRPTLRYLSLALLLAGAITTRFPLSQ